MTFTENNRYAYDLTPDSVVIDVGGYEGKWGRLMAEKYGCHVHIFEPIEQFYRGIMSNLIGHPQRDRITVHHFGVAATTRDETFRIHGDMTGIVASGPEETVKLLGISDLLSNALFADKEISVLKLNCEGCEFEILESLLDDGLDVRCKHIQVQPHSVVPRAAERWAGIRNRLLMNFKVSSEDPNLDNGWLLVERKG